MGQGKMGRGWAWGFKPKAAETPPTRVLSNLSHVSVFGEGEGQINQIKGINK